MVQKRIHDYRGPRSSENLNGHLVGVIPSGVYQGFHVSADGSISPGVLVTAEGVRIEETEAIAVAPPAGDPDYPRIDLIVCVHEVEKTVPAPEALFNVVTGTPAEAPLVPDLPDHAVLLAVGSMAAGATQWQSPVSQAGPPARGVNVLQWPDRTWHIVRGSLGALLEVWSPNTGTMSVIVVEPGTLADGDLITGPPVLQFDAEGIQQVLAVQGDLEQEIEDRQGADSDLDEAKLDKAGGTISGDLEVQGKLTLDADDVADVAFDDWVSFTHWVQPCEGNSKDWENLGFAWKSVEDALGKTLYVPIRGMIGAELVSVDVGLYNLGSVAYNVILGFSTTDLADYIGGAVDFGEVTVPVSGSESVVTNVILVDPQEPHDFLPFALRSHCTSFFGFATISPAR